MVKVLHIVVDTNRLTSFFVSVETRRSKTRGSMGLLFHYLRELCEIRNHVLEQRKAVSGFGVLLANSIDDRFIVFKNAELLGLEVRKKEPLSFLDLRHRDNCNFVFCCTVWGWAWRFEEV